MKNYHKSLSVKDVAPVSPTLFPLIESTLSVLFSAGDLARDFVPILPILFLRKSIISSFELLRKNLAKNIAPIWLILFTDKLSFDTVYGFVGVWKDSLNLHH